MTRKVRNFRQNPEAQNATLLASLLLAAVTKPYGGQDQNEMKTGLPVRYLCVSLRASPRLTGRRQVGIFRPRCLNS